MATTRRKGGADRAPSIEEQTQEEIARLAQAKYVANAAIDAAVAMVQEKRGPEPTATQLKAKHRVQLADIKGELLARVAEGESVFTICHSQHMPARVTVYKWIREDPAFREEYESALQQRADKYVEMIADLSAQVQRRAAMGASSEEVTALKTYINSLQWIAARLHPKKYGDKQTLDVDQRVTMTEPQLNARLQALIDRAKGAKG